VAVSKPGLRDRLGDRAQDAVDQPSLVEVLLQLLLVERAALHLTEHAEDLPQYQQVDDADQQQEDPGDGGADQPGGLLQGRRAVLDLTGERLDPEREQQAEAEDDAGVP
jgi:hypothetical protein